MTHIRETMVTQKTGHYKETSVILHCYTLTKNSLHQYRYSEDKIPNLNDGKRHRVRSFIIAHNDKEYPNKIELKKLLKPVKLEKNHMNVKNCQEYGENLGGFCTECVAQVKKECKKKFGRNW